MSSPEEKKKHSRRRLRSKIAKEMITSGKYKQRVVKDKKGNKVDLGKINFRDLVELIQEDDNVD